ncbi:hypothetical protein NARC_160043 [Candidatus Nitrosocosmicus arcticus]|uniref:Uncharacterized protein n=1 Tax=Candidatus Nitrosocosmicus arcticus TaxID=2035267 RepID=A0A557SRU6_9ARCH|nr:hypothetical protein NARC_160043 [Candidatus Nitrosocosmicus arcticus]
MSLFINYLIIVYQKSNFSFKLLYKKLFQPILDPCGYPHDFTGPLYHTELNPTEPAGNYTLLIGVLDLSF